MGLVQPVANVVEIKTATIATTGNTSVANRRFIGQKHDLQEFKRCCGVRKHYEPRIPQNPNDPISKSDNGSPARRVELLGGQSNVAVT